MGNDCLDDKELVCKKVNSYVESNTVKRSCISYCKKLA